MTKVIGQGHVLALVSMATRWVWLMSSIEDSLFSGGVLKCPEHWGDLMLFYLWVRVTYYRYEHGGGVQRGGTGVSPGHHGGDAVRRSAAPLARWCRRVRPRHRPRRTDHSQHRCPRSAAPSQLRRAQGTRRTVRHPSILTLAAQCALIAKFHYTDPTRTGPDTDKVRAHCRVRAKFHYTDPTRTRPDPHGPARTFLRRNSVGSVRVRSGPCSGI